MITRYEYKKMLHIARRMVRSLRKGKDDNIDLSHYHENIAKPYYEARKKRGIKI